MNYRHHFHAGNFADVMKHAMLMALVRAMRARGPVRVVETHAGAGLYDLQGEAATRSNEAEGGVGRLMTAKDLPPEAADLRQVVRAENVGDRLRYYPGSPLVALSAMSAGDSYLGFELRPDDQASLAQLLAGRTAAGGAKAGSVLADGYAALTREVTARDLVLIDPPFERGDEYDRLVEAAAVCMARGAALAIWAPIKDLQTLDGLVSRLEALGPKRLSLAQVRLRPLANPMKMNGSAILTLNTPAIEPAGETICRWVAENCGEHDAKGKVELLVG